MVDKCCINRITVHGRSCMRVARQMEVPVIRKMSRVDLASTASVTNLVAMVVAAYVG